MIDLLLFPLAVALGAIEAVLPYLLPLIIGVGLGLLCFALVALHGTRKARQTQRLRDYLDGL